MATPQPGYLLAVDLGTSNTVAVIRWPDGRTRPLLVDGAPVMPSAVFVDESGHVHVGRDAQRLAQTDPGRYEPNPKQRTEEPTILLGDREVPTVSLLTAILRAVADKAIEAVGFLPPAVLTYPAKWGSIRREMLQDAAAKAGFPPVHLVPEPIGAAHYFASVMQQPIPVGASVAVFDFGGGTLDIAIVRNQGRDGFQVLGDGGLKDLGGLDVDAALVAHLGRTIDHNAPDLWRRLANPESTTDKRGRRQFWDDVRGAKEMLSRTTVAPVPVPGVDHSLHLTRDELERLAGPLLERAVEETRRVITAASLTPQQLHGLFLVGGASRIPLVSRMLHQRLGIAPIVLEQPELPVAEGALATVPQRQLHEPMTIGPTSGIPVNATEPYTPPPGAETGAGTPVSPAPQGMNAPPEGFITPLVKPPWWKKKSTWIAAAATVAVLAVGTWWLTRDAYPQEPMHALTAVGSPVAFGGGFQSIGFSDVDIESGVAYNLAASSNGTAAEVVAVDLETGKEKWRTPSPLTATSSFTTVWAENGIVVAMAENTTTPDSAIVLDPDSGATKATIPFDSTKDYFFVIGENLILRDVTNKAVVGYTPDGKEKWRVAADSGATEAVDWEPFVEPANSAAEEGGRFATKSSDGTLAIWSAEDGRQIAAAQILQDPDKTTVMVFGDKVFTTVSGANGYTVGTYSAKDLKGITTTQVTGADRQPDYMIVCGETRVCVLEKKPTTGGAKLVVFDAADGMKELWTSPAELDVKEAKVVGESLAVTWNKVEGNAYGTSMYDKDLKPLGGEHLAWFGRVDSGSLLAFPTTGSSPANASINGLGALDGQETVLGTVKAAACDADEAHLACVTDKGYEVWRFRD